MRGAKVISIVLSICFSVFLGHNLVPHHHHAEIVNVPVSSACPLDHHLCSEDSVPVCCEEQAGHEGHEGHEHDSDSHPVHCHAFNDVVFDKYGAPDIQPQTSKIIILFAAISNNLSDTPDSAIPYPYSRIKIPDKSITFFGSRSLRGPPQRV